VLEDAPRERCYLLGLWLVKTRVECLDLHYSLTENCHPLSNVSGYDAVKKIRSVAHYFGTVKLFKAYLQLSELSASSKFLLLRSELQASGVSLTDCPHNGRKDVADKMMLGRCSFMIEFSGGEFTST